MSERLTDRQLKTLEAVENYEEFFSFQTGGVFRNKTPYPQNAIRARERLPLTTSEEILETRAKKIKAHMRGERNDRAE